MFGRNLNERLMKITDENVVEKERGISKGRGRVEQIFAMKMVVAQQLERCRKLFAASTHLDGPYEMGDVCPEGTACRVQCVGGRLI